MNKPHANLQMSCAPNKHYEIDNQSTYIATKNKPATFVIGMSGPRNGCKCCVRLVIEWLNHLLRNPKKFFICPTAREWHQAITATEAGLQTLDASSLLALHYAFQWILLAASYVTKLCLPARTFPIGRMRLLKKTNIATRYAVKRNRLPHTNMKTSQKKPKY